MIDGKPYPCWIFHTRYGGTYEGGEWATINCEPSQLPDDAQGSDPDAAEWWATARANEGKFGEDYYGPWIIAVGDSPQAAIESLIQLCEKHGG